MLRELDPGHPIWIVHACGNTVETLRRFNASCDIVGCNPYPVYVEGMRQHIGVRADGRMLDCPDQSLHAVGAYTRKMLHVGQGRPAWMLVQAMANEYWYNPLHTPKYADRGIDETKVRYPTCAEMHFMAYDAIVSGATGLAFSMWKTPVGSDAWHSIVRLVGELRGLHGLLCAPLAPRIPRSACTDLGTTIWDGIRVLARADEDDYLLIAVNTQGDTMEARISGITAGGDDLHVVGENRKVALRRNAICDRFSPFGVHVYSSRAVG